MPTIHIEAGFRFSLYPNDHNPPHLHVKKGDDAAKIEIETGNLLKNDGMKAQELKKAKEIIAENKALFLLKFKEHINE
jgi:Domain of unknown function (DUF4160)